MEWRLLQGVPGEDVRRVLAVARRATYRKNEIVFHQGNPADSLHLISKGRFAILVATPLGEQATLAIRGSGESFGEMAIAGAGAKRSATVEALEDAETFCVGQSEFRRLRREHRESTSYSSIFWRRRCAGSTTGCSRRSTSPSSGESFAGSPS